jgi:hypothetical protein
MASLDQDRPDHKLSAEFGRGGCRSSHKAIPILTTPRHRPGYPLTSRLRQCMSNNAESGIQIPGAYYGSVDIVETQAPRLIYHVLHPLMVRWETVLSGVKEAGVTFDTVDAKQWLDRVGASIEANDQDPSAGMISMWRDAVSAFLPFL